MPRTMTISRSSRCCLPPAMKKSLDSRDCWPSVFERFSRSGASEPIGNPEESDPLAREQPWLAGLYAASVRGRLGKFGTYGTVGILPSSVLNPPPVQNSLESPGLVYIIGYTATLPPLFEFPTFGSRFTRHVE